MQGLFEVVGGIYQVRGFDLSNVTFVEGDTGVIVIDPLISTATGSPASRSQTSGNLGRERHLNPSRTGQRNPRSPSTSRSVGLPSSWRS